MVLVGKINQNTVSEINRLGGKAVGLSGKDGAMMKCRKKYAKIADGDKVHQVDIGMVGEVESFDNTLINNMLDDDYIPVIAPIGTDGDGGTYNVNADYAACKIAAALGAEKLFLLTDVEGILLDVNDKNSLISSIKASEMPLLIQDHIISKGMIPKVESCIKAIEDGVNGVHIIDGRVPHSILLELFTDSGVGYHGNKGVNYGLYRRWQKCFDGHLRQIPHRVGTGRRALGMGYRRKAIPRLYLRYFRE